MDEVTIHTFQQVDTKGAHVVAAFPSVGLVATIAATYLVEELGLSQVGVMDSPRFPTLCVVEEGAPLNPVRIYAGHYGQGDRIRPVVVFLSEFQPSPELVRPVSEAILAWCREAGCTAIVTPEGLLLEGDGPEVYAAASTADMRQALADRGAQLFGQGIVAGVTGVLLNLGRRDQFPVVAVLSRARQGQPDARSAAAVVDLLATLVGADMDGSRLRDEADAFDRHVDEVQRRRRLQDSPPTAAMYG